jgi:F0F1-type ATP synthase membrane subunit a
LSVTNSAVYCLITFASIYAIWSLLLKGGLVVPSNYQVCAEMLYTFITSLVREQLGQANGAKYMYYCISLYFNSQSIGLIPFSFATTATCCCFWSEL